MHQGCDTVGQNTPTMTGLRDMGHSSDGVRTERQIVWSLIGGMLVVSTVVAKRFDYAPQVADIPAFVGAVILSWPHIWQAGKELINRRASSASLAALAILAAFVVGEYVTAGLLAFILSIAGQIVNRTAFGAERAIQQLVHLTPDVARVVVEGKERETKASMVVIGDIVRMKPGENLPVDGVLVTGHSTINQASLTGEAVPHEVGEGDSVYAGTTNLTGGFDFRVTQVGEDTTIGKVSQLIAEAESTKTQRQLLIEQVSRFFVPVALMIAFVVWFIASQSSVASVQESSASRAITVLIVACPAALLLASPSAMVAAFAAAARLGILVKRTEYLEGAAHLDAVVMDKTGTITTGIFEVSKLVPAEGVEGKDLLRAAANAEQHSNHPLAKSIITTAEKANLNITPNDTFEEVHGRGIRATTEGGELCVGRSSWLLELNPGIKSGVDRVEHRIEGMTGVHVMLGGKYLGVVGLEDQIKPDVKGVVSKLRELGVRNIAIFTGDRLSVAKRVGAAVGVDTIEAECLPEEKHAQIKQMVAAGYRTMMVGDGINDGPSLAAADIGVAMGLSGSDIATNSAGVALMNDDLDRVPFLIELSRKTRQIVAQNIAVSILIVLIGLVLSSSGLLGVPAAALYHFAGEVFVLANSFRLFRFGEDFATADAEAHKPGQVWTTREASVRGLGRTQTA